MTVASNATNANVSSMDIVKTQSIDDEHAPGVFEVRLNLKFCNAVNV